MYSVDGFIEYSVAWLLELLWSILAMITILPIPIWLKIFDGGDFADVITFLIYYPNWFGLTWLLASFF